MMKFNVKVHVSNLYLHIQWAYSCFFLYHNYTLPLWVGRPLHLSFFIILVSYESDAKRFWYGTRRENWNFCCQVLCYSFVNSFLTDQYRRNQYLVDDYYETVITAVNTAVTLQCPTPSFERDSFNCHKLSGSFREGFYPFAAYRAIFNLVRKADSRRTCINFCGPHVIA
jgi:hypothetical protein